MDALGQNIPRIALAASAPGAIPWMVMIPIALLSLALEAQVDFARQVHPVLVARCGACHTGDKAQAGLDVNTRAELLKGGAGGPAILPGNSAGSLLIRRVDGSKEPRMPLRGDPLTNEEIGILKTWVDEGARGADPPGVTRWVAPLKPRKPEVPGGGAHPVDAFLNAAGDPVSDAVFARRAYLDLWGLLPTPEQLAEFEAATDPAKRTQLIDRLLRHEKHYAANWIAFWNDLLRNDDGVTYHGERKSITPWLRAALESNLPYDRFVAELISPKGKRGPEGYILGVTWRGEVPASERPPLQAAQNSAQTFLGINLKCNSCHDSFISNWKLKDAYGLASFFSEKPLELVRCDVKTGEFSQPKFPFPELGAVKTEGSLEERRAEAARLFTSPENGRLTRTIVNRYWKKLFGRGIVEPVDDMAAEPWNPDLLDWLASDFSEHGYDLKYLLRQVMTSRAYQLPSIDEESKPGARYTFRGPEKRRLSAEQFADAVGSITGEWRPYPSNAPSPTYFAREWQLKSTALTRALGRPVRDQVVTDRLTQPTTLQALELVNGSQLANWLREGGKRLAGELRPAPENLFDSGMFRRNPVDVDIDIKNSSKLYLLVENADSYDATRVVPQWRDAVLIGKGKVRKPLEELLPAGADLGKLSLPSRLEVTLPEGEYTRFQATAGVSRFSQTSDVGPAIRFFVFDREPDPKRLVKVDGYLPVAGPDGPFTSDTLTARLYKHALQREPDETERAIAREVLGEKLASSRVEDLLWMLMLAPEFQYIR